MNNRAFTLLELLVVITIIGILSSIVIVSMSGSTDSATIAKGKAYAQQVHALLGANAVGVWNFDEGTGTIVRDISGYGNDGTLEGNTHFVSSDIKRYALSFDGNDDYVSINNLDVDLSSGRKNTVDFWIFWDGSEKTCMPFEWSSSYNLDISPMGYFGFNCRASDIYGIVIPSDIIQKWAHIVAIFNNGDYHENSLYINGEKKVLSQLAGTGCTRSITSSGRIGSFYGLYCFSGFMDEVRIYSEALPSTEIQKHYVRGLERLLSNQAITQAEYNQRMEEFNQFLASSL
jgi:prepilin-type N-terminal cleavage/methylation domain-containing protein